MRLAIAGKGGSGKTTIAATLARLYGRGGRQVIAVDDDPNPNLAVALGVREALGSEPQRLPADLLQERTNPNGERVIELTIPLEEVARQYGIEGPEGVRVLQGTGIVGAGRG